MKISIAANHGGYELKQRTYILLCTGLHQIVDFGNLQYQQGR